MNRNAQIAVFAIMIISLVGNAILGVVLYKEDQLAVSSIQELNKVNEEISTIKQNLSETQLQFENTKTELAKKTESLLDVTSKYADAVGKLNRLLCSTTISSEQIRNVSTNQGLLELINQTSEAYYSINSVNISFELLWNNTKPRCSLLIGPIKPPRKRL